MTTSFKEELEIFRREQEEAQQHFFAYLGVRSLTANADVLNLLNRNPTYWVTSQRALLVATFITLGRIFDPTSKHNVGKLLNAIDLATFTRAALQQRRQTEDHFSAAMARKYVRYKRDLKVGHVRKLKKQVARWRKIFDDKYRPIRHQHFAHKELSRIEANALLARTRINEMKRMLGFLHALHTALWELFNNGRKPTLAKVVFVLPPTPKPDRELLPGEAACHEAQAALLMMR